MSGWSNMDTVLLFVVQYAYVRVLLPMVDGWHDVTAIKTEGSGLRFRVEGQEWDVSIHECSAVSLSLKKQGKDNL